MHNAERSGSTAVQSSVKPRRSGRGESSSRSSSSSSRRRRRDLSGEDKWWKAHREIWELEAAASQQRLKAELDAASAKIRNMEIRCEQLVAQQVRDAEARRMSEKRAASAAEAAARVQEEQQAALHSYESKLAHARRVTAEWQTRTAAAEQRLSEQGRLAAERLHAEINDVASREQKQVEAKERALRDHMASQEQEVTLLRERLQQSSLWYKQMIDANAKSELLSQELEGLNFVNAEVTHLKAQVAEQQQLLAEKDATLKEHKAQLAARDMQLAEHTRYMGEIQEEVELHTATLGDELKTLQAAFNDIQRQLYTTESALHAAQEELETEQQCTFALRAEVCESRAETERLAALVASADALADGMRSRVARALTLLGEGDTSFMSSCINIERAVAEQHASHEARLGAWDALYRRLTLALMPEGWATDAEAAEHGRPSIASQASAELEHSKQVLQLLSQLLNKERMLQTEVAALFHQSSASGHPAAASIASRACLISASRIHMRER